MILNIDDQKDVHLFLSFSTDGFEVFLNSATRRDTWPLMFCVMNFDFK